MEIGEGVLVLVEVVGGMAAAVVVVEVEVGVAEVEGWM